MYVSYFFIFKSIYFASLVAVSPLLSQKGHGPEKLLSEPTFTATPATKASPEPKHTSTT